MMATNEVARRYDALRASIPCVAPPDLLAMTSGVAALGEEVMAQALLKVRQFDQFNEDNNPWGEHDFGAFGIAGERFFFKIDDHGMVDGYRLVLTIMLDYEY